MENRIIPALKEEKVVISDRYFFSSFAYGSADGVELTELIKMNNAFLLPDLTFILRTRPEVCIRRIEERGKPKTLFENKERLTKVWRAYEKFPAMFENIVMIEGERSVDEVFEEVKKNIFEKFSENFYED